MVEEARAQRTGGLVELRLGVIAFLLVLFCAGVARADPSLVWNRTLGGEGYDEAKAVVPSGDGGFIIAGSTSSFGARHDDVYVVKVDSIGNKVWERIYGTGKNDYAQGVVQSPDGGFVIAGYANCPLSAGTTDSCDIYLLKIDARGERIWERIWGGDGYEWANCIAQSGDGGFIVGGSISGDAYVLKIDSEGNKTWERTYGSSKDERIYAITDSGDGGFILTGYGNNEQDVYVLRIDSEGDTIWEKTYGGPDRDYGWAIARGSEGFVVVGSTYSEPFPDLYLLGLGRDGDQAWERIYSATTRLTARGTAQSGEGFIVVGRLGEQAYLLQINRYGDKVWEMTNPYCNEATAIAEAASGEFVFVGSDFYVARIRGTTSPIPELPIMGLMVVLVVLGCRSGFRLPGHTSGVTIATSDRHGEQGGDHARKAVFVFTALALSMVPLGFAQNYSDLSPLTGSMIASQVIDFDVAKDSRGEIVVVYSRENATGGMTISLARMDAGSWCHLPVQIPLRSNSTTSITFMEDSTGIYWIAYATRQSLWRGGSGYIERINTSIWLSKSGDRGSTWSSPLLAVRYTSLYELNIGISPRLSLAEDQVGGMWLVWGHACRSSLNAYRSRSEDRGQTWSSPTLFPEFDGMSPGYYEGFFSDHQGNLYLVYRKNIYLGRGVLTQIVSTDYGETWGKGEPEYLLPRDNNEIRYARPFLEQGPNSSGLWLLWLSYSQVHPEIPRRSLVVEYSPDLGSSWEHYGFFNTSSLQNGDQYALIPSTEEPGKLWILWLLGDHRLLYKSVPDASLASMAIVTLLSVMLLSRMGKAFLKRCWG